MERLSLISKPHIVDLLRHFDRKRWIIPRIRYASVRSKPELIKDILEIFFVKKRGNLITLQPTRPGLMIPSIKYDLDNRLYLIGGVAHDMPKESRERPVFSIRKGPVTLDFSAYY